MPENLLKDCKIVLANTSAAAGQSTIDTAGINAAGYDGVCFIAILNAVVDGAQPTLAAQASLTSGGAYAQIASQITPAVTAAGNSNTILVCDTQFPSGSGAKNWVRAELVRATQNVTLGGIVAILYRGKSLPVTLDASVLASILGLGS